MVCRVKYQVYNDAKLLNDKGVMAWYLTLKRRVLTRSLSTIQAIHALFTRHRLEWTSPNVGRYSEVMVQEFYASYVATLRSQLERQPTQAKHAPLEYV